MSNEAIPLNYIPILVFIAIALGFGVVSLLAGWVVRPSRPYRAKLAPYESGSPLFSDARVQFPIRYYVIAMLFVIFDIEIVFLFPWAVVYRKLGLLGLVEMAVFIGILVVGFWYAWKKGALEWDLRRVPWNGLRARRALHAQKVLSSGQPRCLSPGRENVLGQFGTGGRPGHLGVGRVRICAQPRLSQTPWSPIPTLRRQGDL